MKTQNHFPFSCKNGCDPRDINFSYLLHILVILYSVNSAYRNYYSLIQENIFFFLHRILKYYVRINPGQQDRNSNYKLYSEFSSVKKSNQRSNHMFSYLSQTFTTSLLAYLYSQQPVSSGPTPMLQVKTYFVSEHSGS